MTGCALSLIPAVTLDKLALLSRWVLGLLDMVALVWVLGVCVLGSPGVPWPTLHPQTSRVRSATESDAACSQLLLLLTSLCNDTCHQPHKYKLWVLEPFSCSLCFQGNPAPLGLRCLTSSCSSTPTVHQNLQQLFPLVRLYPCFGCWAEQS